MKAKKKNVCEICKDKEAEIKCEICGALLCDQHAHFSDQGWICSDCEYNELIGFEAIKVKG